MKIVHFDDATKVIKEYFAQWKIDFVDSSELIKYANRSNTLKTMTLHFPFERFRNYAKKLSHALQSLHKCLLDN